MNTQQFEGLAEVHEALGDKYLLLMKLHGVRHPPVVGWLSCPRGVYTSGAVLWEDEEPDIIQGDRRELPELVAQCVLSRLGSGN